MQHSSVSPASVPVMPTSRVECGALSKTRTPMQIPAPPPPKICGAVMSQSCTVIQCQESPVSRHGLNALRHLCISSIRPREREREMIVCTMFGACCNAVLVQSVLHAEAALRAAAGLLQTATAADACQAELCTREGSVNLAYRAVHLVHIFCGAIDSVPALKTVSVKIRLDSIFLTPSSSCSLGRASAVSVVVRAQHNRQKCHLPG